jgi:hypothetical protein
VWATLSAASWGGLRCPLGLLIILLPPLPPCASTGNHAFETLQGTISGASGYRDPKIQAVMWLQAEASRRGYAHTQGEQVRARTRAPRRAGLAAEREDGRPLPAPQAAVFCWRQLRTLAC